MLPVWRNEYSIPCILTWLSRMLRRERTVRNLSSGVAPSKTKSGLIRWYKRRSIRRSVPMRWAFFRIFPSSSLIALINCVIQILASIARVLPSSVSIDTLRPIGDNSCQRSLTPMFHYLFSYYFADEVEVQQFLHYFFPNNAPQVYFFLLCFSFYPFHCAHTNNFFIILKRSLIINHLCL